MDAATVRGLAQNDPGPVLEAGLLQFPTTNTPRKRSLCRASATDQHFLRTLDEVAADVALAGTRSYGTFGEAGRLQIQTVFRDGPAPVPHPGNGSAVVQWSVPQTLIPMPVPVGTFSPKAVQFSATTATVDIMAKRSWGFLAWRGASGTGPRTSCKLFIGCL